VFCELQAEAHNGGIAFQHAGCCVMKMELPTVLLAGQQDIAPWQLACPRVPCTVLHLAEAAEVEALVEAALAAGVRGMLPLNLAAWPAVAEAAQRLKLPHLIPTPAEPWLLTVQDAIARPNERAVLLAPDAREVPDEVTEPYWIRSGLSVANACCLRVDHAGDFPLVVQKLRRHGEGAPILLQHALPGTQYVVLAFKLGRETRVVEVLAQETLQGMYQVPMSWSMPCGLPGGTYAAILEATRRAGAALPAEYGLIASTYVLSGARPVLIEVLPLLQPHPVLLTLIQHALGIDLLAAMLAVALGHEPDLSPRRDMAAKALCTESRSGVVVAVEGVAEAQALPGVLCARAGVQAGERVGHVIDLASRERSVCVAAEGPSLARVQETLAHALDLIHVVTRSTIA
jgi:hypothetical protein